jgi:hypothetical protein
VNKKEILVTTSEPTTQEWKRLYDAMQQIKELAPWEWMTESDVFGVKNPEIGEIGFVSVMGMLGEHISIAVYPGAKAIYKLWDFIERAENQENVAPEEILEIPQLQATFEDREAITAKDREVHKKLGLKFRGRQAWPHFRSYRPGFAPWYLDAAEARFLAMALEQVAEVAPRFDEDPSLLVPEEDDAFFVRVPDTTGDEVSWRDEEVVVPPPAPTHLTAQGPAQILATVARLPKGRSKLEVDFFMMPQQIGERGERPQYAYNLLVADANSGLILGMDVAMVETTFEEMLATIPARLLQILARSDSAPAEIYVSSPRLHWILEPVLKLVQVKVTLVQRLTTIELVKQEMSAFFM